MEEEVEKKEEEDEKAVFTHENCGKLRGILSTHNASNIDPNHGSMRDSP